MRYDASSKIQDDVRKTLGLDPRMIKFSSVKLGDGTLESLSKIGGKIAVRETPFLYIPKITFRTWMLTMVPLSGLRGKNFEKQTRINE